MKGDWVGEKQLIEDIAADRTHLTPVVFFGAVGKVSNSFAEELRVSNAFFVAHNNFLEWITQIHVLYCM